MQLILQSAVMDFLQCAEQTEKLIIPEPEISLEQSFLLYQSGVEKLKECNVMLDTVEKKMQILNAKGELEDF